MSEVDVGSIAVKLELFCQYSTTFCCYVTDGRRRTFWQNGIRLCVWKGIQSNVVELNSSMRQKLHPSTFIDKCRIYRDQTMDVSTVKWLLGLLILLLLFLLSLLLASKSIYWFGMNPFILADSAVRLVNLHNISRKGRRLGWMPWRNIFLSVFLNFPYFNVRVMVFTFLKLICKGTVQNLDY